MKLAWKTIFGERLKTDVLLILSWFAAVLFVSPFGDFPINDDWAYAKNVYNLAHDGKFVVDTFPAMNLVSQTFYGAVIAKLFGFSFLSLRLSILLLSVVASLVLKRTLEILIPGNYWYSLMMTLVFFFNPISLLLSMTFMTDLFFISMIVFSVYFFLRYSNTGNPWFYVLFCAFCVGAVLCRQHGLLLSCLTFSLLRRKEPRLWQVVTVLFAPLLTWFVHDQYRHLLTEHHVAHGIKNLDDLLVLMVQTPLSIYEIRFANSLVLTGLLLLPLSLLQLSAVWKNDKSFWLIFLPSLAIVVYFLNRIWDSFPIGNFFGILESGPRLLKKDHELSYHGSLDLIRRVALVIGGCSAAVVLTLLVRQVTSIQQRFPGLGILMGMGAILWLFLAIASDAYFDRYNLPVVLLLLFLLVPEPGITFPKIARIFSYSAGCLAVIFSVGQTRDYFRWQETKWQALHCLEEANVSAAQLDGGFEYHGWYKPINTWSEPGKSWWWVQDDLYAVSSQRLKSYNMIGYLLPSSVIDPLQDTLYVLRRNTP